MTSFKIKIKPVHLFEFQFWHQYSGIYGLLNVAITAGSVALLITGVGQGSFATMFVLIVLALLFSVINPILIFVKALIAYKITPVYKEPLEYELTNEKLVVKQGEAATEETLDKIVAIRKTPKMIVLYFGSANAVLLPKKQLGEEKKKVCDILSEARPEFARRLKKV